MFDDGASPQSRALARMVADARRPAGEALYRLERERKSQDDVVKDCREWIASHKKGPMYWARNLTATENYQWKAQDLPSVAPIPLRPHPSLTSEHLQALSAAGIVHDFSMADPPDYLDVVMGFLLSTKELFLPKTRQMLTSWMVVHFIVWMCQFFEKTQWIGQSEDDLKAQGLIKYANILYFNQPGWLRQRFRLKGSNMEGTSHKIEWKNGSSFLALPSGIRKFASAHSHGYFNDETAHQPAAEATINIVKPAVKQIVCVSSVAPGWFWSQVGDAGV